MTGKKKKQTEDGDSPSLKIWLAIIPGLVAIIIALFNFPPFQRLFYAPTATPTSASEPTLTKLPFETLTPTPTKIVTLIPAPETPTITLTPPPTLATGMFVSLVANQTRGNIPLKVRLNTKDSIYRDPAGTEFLCGACNFTWQVRQGGNIIFGPQKGEATFEYTFRDRGTYFVTVVICRNQGGDCGSSGALIVAE